MTTGRLALIGCPATAKAGNTKCAKLGVKVDSGPTVTVNADDVLGRKLEPPAKVAVTEFGPAGNTEVVSTAMPPFPSGAEPMTVVPVKKVTVAPAPGDMP